MLYFLVAAIAAFFSRKTYVIVVFLGLVVLALLSVAISSGRFGMGLIVELILWVEYIIATVSAFYAAEHMIRSHEASSLIREDEDPLDQDRNGL